MSQNRERRLRRLTLVLGPPREAAGKKGLTVVDAPLGSQAIPARQKTLPNQTG